MDLRLGTHSKNASSMDWSMKKEHPSTNFEQFMIFEDYDFLKIMISGRFRIPHDQSPVTERSTFYWN